MDGDDALDAASEHGGAAATRSSSALRIHNELRRQIIQGAIPPGQILSQVALAQEFGTSRGPIREALRLLEREGLIESEVNKRVWVKPIELDDLEQLYALRILTEAFATRVTVPLLSAEDLARLRELVAVLELSPDDDMDRWEQAHSAFHQLLGCRAGERTEAMIGQYLDHAIRYRQLHMTRAPQSAAASIAEHRAIVDACAQGDAIGASRLVAEHLARTSLTVFAMVAASHEPKLIRTALRMVTATSE